MNIQFTDPKPGELEMLAAAGFKWVRTDLTWATTERKLGAYDFSPYDRLVTALDKHKIRAVFVLNYGNPLYAEQGDKHPFTTRVHTPEFRDAFARWAVAAITHFKGRGYLWELWNEPNLAESWKSPAGRDDYIALAKSTGEALRAAKLLGEKGEAFIGPATSTIDQTFLEACFRAGLLEFWDAVSVHPFRQTEPETVEEEYRSLRLLIRKYAPKNKTIPIVSSGWGYSSAWKKFDERSQAKFLPRQLLTNIANDVALSIWHDWRDSGLNPAYAEHHFGLVAHEYHAGRDPVYDSKPEYRAMKTLTEQLGGFRFNKSLAFNVGWSQYDRVLLFEKANEVRLAAWGYGNMDQAIELPASAGAMTVVRSDGAKVDYPAMQGANRFGIKYMPSADPAYLLFPKANELLSIAASVTRLPLDLIFDTSGDSPQLGIGFTNPLPISVSARLGTPDRFRQLLICAPTDLQKQLVPTGTRFVRHFSAQSGSRKAAGIPLLLGLEIAPTLETHIHENVPIYQTVTLNPSLPLKVSRMPSLAAEVVVRIENPSGRYWKGTVQARGTGYKGGSLNLSAKVDVILLKETPAVVARIPLIKPEGRDISWVRVTGIALASPDSSVSEVPVPDMRLVPLDVPNVEILPDGDSKTEAVPAANPEPPADGAVAENVPTLRLKYSFGAERKFYRVINPTWPPPGEKNLIENPKTFGLWVYGDGGGCVPRMRFMDSTGQIFQSSGPKIDWKGWRQVFFPMRSTPENPLECWGGEDDGKIHYPIEFDSIFLFERTLGARNSTARFSSARRR